MSQFVYQAVDKRGKRHRGKIVATSNSNAIAQLKEKGLYVTELKQSRLEGSAWNMEINFGPLVKPQEFATFSRQLATLLRAGVPIVKSIQALADQAEGKAFKKVLNTIVDDLTKGNQFSQATAEHPKVFPPIFVNMVKAGEASGNLDEVLDRLATFFEREYYTRQKVKSALTYPVIVSVLSLFVTIFLLVTVIPTFVTMFKTVNAPLPLPTKIVLAVSQFLTNRWYIGLSCVLLIGIVYYLFSRSESGKYTKDYIKLKIPVFGMLFRKAAIARMARTMGSLFASAVPVLQAISITSNVVGNRVIGKALQGASTSLQEGQGLSEPFARSGMFPPIVVQMISVGEETGNLDTMLNKVADFYESDVEIMVDRMKSLLEPFLVLLLTSIVGTIVTSVILPVFEILNYIH